MTKYKSREFCRDIDCFVQKGLDREEIDEFTKEIGKRHCKENCKAYEFHQWLKENDYEIVKDLDYITIVLREWFDELENRLNDNLDAEDYMNIGLHEPLENIQNCIYDLEGKLEEDLRKLREKKKEQDYDEMKYMTGHY